MTNPRRLTILAVGVLLLVGVAYASFSLTRATNTTLPAAAQLAPTPTPDELRSRERFWYRPVMDEEAAKPRLDTVLAGIRIGPDVGEIDVCAAVGRSGAVPSRVDLSEASSRAPALALNVPRPPTQAYTVDGPGLGGVNCDGAIGMTSVQYQVPQSEDSLYGGRIYIARSRGPRLAQIDVAFDRAVETTIGGRSAVLILPLTEDGFGESFALIADPGGLTYIQAWGLPISVVTRVAEGLYGEGASE
jgi:hypothetical protein